MGTSQIESDVIYFSASGILLNMHDETLKDLLSSLRKSHTASALVLLQFADIEIKGKCPLLLRN